MTLVVLAAGMGSRYGGLKQLDPITEHGEFIIDFSVYDALRAGYDKVVFIIKRENEALFRETIGRRIEKVIRVEYVFQEMSDEVKKCFPSDRVKPLGTAHALLCARDAIQGPFSVINADDFYGQSAYRLAASYLTD
ncbi:MAG: nucleotidyltransferase, partial [Clostridia bacterium]|nr:nucleotidyltransferase [Clostridia bacterium]